MKIELVQFSNGKFGVRRKVLWMDQYLSKTADLWYSDAEDVNGYCQFDTKEQAESDYNLYKDTHMIKVDKIEKEL